ncbi:linalool 8-monooxygenase [Mycolicibacterium moriokaense]|uniref:Steroid C26-monooxygenase n=1 Tax=Mycolicibacterium moriokaense TaxID=39691 RepID=A0AAD1H893_9MYCO|nr:cytochrome P450 [Mycolicibacterium moriokaense]MCV7039182.1 cytochrome P450 [Mycolicibacterium moriokaense]ORB18536.1 linalool 8-monooxygenase [Mycolicibacterium moriokaense]BBX00086.1 cytochrome P450 [Mycolicibacterium moriokaense]
MTVSSRPDIRVLDSDTYANGDPTTFGLPLDQYKYLRDEEPCYLYEFDDPMLVERAWVISRNADIWAVDRNAELYSTARGGVNMWKITPFDAVMGGKPAMLTTEGAKHREQRGVMSKAFNPAMVRRLEEKFREYAVNIVDAALEKGTFNFVTDIGHAMPMEALGDVLGVPPADRPKFFEWVDTFAAPFDTRITPSFEHVFTAVMAIFDYALELGDLKRREPADDVITQLVQAGSDVISQDELQGNVALLAAGAAESTRTALSHGMHELMRNPDQMAWLREHANDIPGTAIQEIVRIATPFTHLLRTATADHEFHGQEIKEGDKVLMMFAAGNFDERAFDDPDTFDLSREKNPHVSFGRGPHQCLGKHVASLEMKILLEELLQRTKDIRPAGDISYIRDAYSRGVYELPITITGA